LPQEDGESDKAYSNRLNRSTFFNKFSGAVRKATGKLFKTGFTTATDLPPELQAFVSDVDMENRDINQFLGEVCEEAMAKGLTYVLVEHPVVEGELTVEEEHTLGVRPYAIHIKPEQLFYWEVSSQQLTLIRFYEDIVVDGETITQIREIAAHSWAIFRKDSTGVWFKYDEGILTIGVVPLVAFYARRTGFMSARPPLEDLLYLNIAHWQSSSDQRHILHVARVPILFGTGLEDGTFEVGPNRLVRGDKGATLGYVEHTGKAIEAGANDLTALEEAMESVSLSPTLQTSPGTQTATGKAIDSAEAEAILNLVRGAWEDAANLMLFFAGLWYSIKIPDSVVTLAKSSSMPLPAGEKLAEIGKARAMGDISRSAYLEALKELGALPDSFDAAKNEIELLGEVK
jgi:hypothetical protein